jgi:hypothetical protein
LPEKDDVLLVILLDPLPDITGVDPETVKPAARTIFPKITDICPKDQVREVVQVAPVQVIFLPNRGMTTEMEQFVPKEKLKKTLS